MGKKKTKQDKREKEKKEEKEMGNAYEAEQRHNK